MINPIKRAQMKRFIAGAKCPSCGQQDTLYWSQDVSGEYIACSRCDHRKSTEELNNENANSENTKTIQIVNL